jgi:BRCA1-associated protein
MPRFFYHLKFELYSPHAAFADQRTAVDTSSHAAREPVPDVGPVFLPPPGTDIFGPLPEHLLRLDNEEQWTWKRKGTGVGYDYGYGSGSGRVTEGAGSADVAGPGVIDCGARRTEPVSGEGNYEILREDGTAPLKSEATHKDEPDLERARRDWRFGRVRVESLDMEVTGNAGLRGKATKGRFESISRRGKNTEMGWGVVHLYRDGEESPELVYEDQGEEGRDEDCTILCIPAVPSYMTPSDFLGWVGESTRDMVSHFRMVMTGRMNRYMVLMKFHDAGEARKWQKEWDGKVFNSMEPENCHVTFIRSIIFQSPESAHASTSNGSRSFPDMIHDPFTPSNSATQLKPFPPPTPNLVELPTCPVCLERMDDTTGLLTILCQHVFHCACLLKWNHSACPVCRHTSSPPTNQPFGASEASLCRVCDCADDLWICLICGNVGCGRYKGGHAKEHWKESGHNFALEIETQHVWDYAGDLWVHRLIREKGDGKLVELPSHRRPGPAQNDTEDEPGLSREKMEGMGMEYTHLLTSQLESQRVYFEELVQKAVDKASSANQAAESASKSAEKALEELEALRVSHALLRTQTQELEKERNRAVTKAEKTSELARKMTQAFQEEKVVSKGLLERVAHLNGSVARLSTELAQARDESAELREQNRDLSFFISSSEKVRDLKEVDGQLGEEIEGGTVSLPEKAPEKALEKRKGKGRKR